MMGRSDQGGRFLSDVLVIVIMVCVCVCGSRTTSQSTSVKNSDVNAQAKIIDVPQRKNPTSCPTGLRMDKNGNCRTVW